MNLQQQRLFWNLQQQRLFWNIHQTCVAYHAEGALKLPCLYAALSVSGATALHQYKLELWDHALKQRNSEAFHAWSCGIWPQDHKTYNDRKDFTMFTSFSPPLHLNQQPRRCATLHELCMSLNMMQHAQRLTAAVGGHGAV